MSETTTRFTSKGVKSGDLLVDLKNRDWRYRLHAEKGKVAEEKMDRIHERIDTLMYWVARIGDDHWPIPPRPTKLAERLITDDCWRDILSVRTMNALLNHYGRGGTPKAIDVLMRPDEELLMVNNLGPRGLEQIKAARARMMEGK